MPQLTPQAGFVMQQGQPGFVQQPQMPSYPPQGQPLQYPYQAPQMPYGQQPYQQQLVQPVNQLIPNALPQATPVQVKKVRDSIMSSILLYKKMNLNKGSTNGHTSSKLRRL